MKLLISFLFCASMLLVVSHGAEETGSLLGKPVTSLTGSLDRYTMRAPAMTAETARYALEHSTLLDPTLPEVRNNAFPLIGRIDLLSGSNVVMRIELCGGLGILHQGAFTYVFRYQLPVDSQK